MKRSIRSLILAFLMILSVTATAQALVWDVEYVEHSFLDGLAFAADDIFAITDQEVVHFDGETWKVSFEDDTNHFTAIWGSGPSDVYVIGSRWSAGACTVYHFDGMGWTDVFSQEGGHFKDIWGSGPDDVYVLHFDYYDDIGTVYHFNGRRWRLRRLDVVWWTWFFTSSFEAVWGTSAEDVFFLCDSSLWMETYYSFLQHRTASTWLPFVPGSFLLLGYCTGNYSMDLWGSGPDDVHIVFNGLLQHYDGRRRTNVGIESSDFIAVGGSAHDNAYAVGYDGLLYDHNGISWHRIDLVDNDLTAACVLSAWNVYILGDGVVLHGHM